MPEFRDANVADYEFDGDGNVVRKDRWESAIREIRHLVGVDSRRFEISEVIAAVRTLADAESPWESLDSGDPEDFPDSGKPVDIRLTDGSVLCRAQFDNKNYVWGWQGQRFEDDVTAWRYSAEPTPEKT